MGATCCCSTKPANVSLEAGSCLGWRAAATVGRGSKPPLVFAVSHTANAEVLKQRVQDFLAKPEVVDKPCFTPKGVDELKPPGSDWRSFSAWMLQRVRSVNALGGPRMRVVSWLTLKQLGRLPMYPADCEHILDAESLLDESIRLQDDKGKVDGRVVCFSFFSHRWERPSMQTLEAHPDSKDNKKCHALAKFGEFGTCPIFAPAHEFDYYFWVDYSSINQGDDCQKQMGVSMLCAYVAACIQIIMYNSFTAEYEPRAWTRLERMLGYTYCACPLFKYLDDDYPSKPLDIDSIVTRNPETFQKDSLSGCLLLKVRDPAGEDSFATDPGDLTFVRQLSDTAKKATPLNPARTWHGVEELVFDECMIPLDTMHYGMDAEKESAKEERLMQKDPASEDVVGTAMAEDHEQEPGHGRRMRKHLTHLVVQGAEEHAARRRTSRSKTWHSSKLTTS